MRCSVESKTSVVLPADMSTAIPPLDSWVAVDETHTAEAAAHGSADLGFKLAKWPLCLPLLHAAPATDAFTRALETGALADVWRKLVPAEWTLMLGATSKRIRAALLHFT